jgi:primase-polymerase (primpol)-like protein
MGAKDYTTAARIHEDAMFQKVRFTSTQALALPKMVELAAVRSGLSQEAIESMKWQIRQQLKEQNFERAATRLKAVIGLNLPA